MDEFNDCVGTIIIRESYDRYRIGHDFLVGNCQQVNIKNDCGVSGDARSTIYPIS